MRSAKEIAANAFNGGGNINLELLVREARADFEPILRQIAAQVTPGANATVKRMGRIANEALDNIRSV